MSRGKTMAEEIRFENNTLIVPDNPIVPFISGDGIGPEIWAASAPIIDAAVSKAYGGSRKISWLEVKAGGQAFDSTGSYLPDETLAALKQYKVSIKGPLMTPVGGGIRSINVTLRKELDLFACVRPIKWFKDIPTPVKHPELCNMVIFRENTEDVYAGIEWKFDSVEVKKIKTFLLKEMGVTSIVFPSTTAIGIKPVSKQGSERLIRAAILYALDHKKPSVTLVHKGNIMKYTEGAFRDWGYDLAESEFQDQVFTWKQFETIKKNEGELVAKQRLNEAKQLNKVIINDCIADAFFQNALLHPEQYSVIATTNLNGDYVSDALAAQVGGIGISPGANINYKKGYAIFESTHGTAPSIAGKNKANPCAILLSAVLLLEYIGWGEAAQCLESCLAQTLEAGQVTEDLVSEGHSPLGTKEFSDAVLMRLK